MILRRLGDSNKQEQMKRNLNLGTKFHIQVPKEIIVCHSEEDDVESLGVSGLNNSDTTWCHFPSNVFNVFTATGTATTREVAIDDLKDSKPIICSSPNNDGRTTMVEDCNRQLSDNQLQVLELFQTEEMMNMFDYQGAKTTVSSNHSVASDTKPFHQDGSHSSIGRQRRRVISRRRIPVRVRAEILQHQLSKAVQFVSPVSKASRSAVARLLVRKQPTTGSVDGNDNDNGRCPAPSICIESIIEEDNTLVGLLGENIHFPDNCFPSICGLSLREEEENLVSSIQKNDINDTDNKDVHNNDTSCDRKNEDYSDGACVAQIDVILLSSLYGQEETIDPEVDNNDQTIMKEESFVIDWPSETMTKESFVTDWPSETIMKESFVADWPSEPIMKELFVADWPTKKIMKESFVEDWPSKKLMKESFVEDWPSLDMMHTSTSETSDTVSELSC